MHPVDLGAAAIVPFIDCFDASDHGSRSVDTTAVLGEVMDRFPNRAIVAIQHSPLCPPIEAEYPYVLTDAEAVMSAYTEAGVALSLSGHYHPGQETVEHAGVSYATCPALSVAPYSFLTVHIGPDGVRVESHGLSLQTEELGDVHVEDFHCHTQFAYCSSGVNIEDALVRANAFGVRRQFFTEHSGQLYLSRDAFWQATFLQDPDNWLRAQGQGRTRMDEYLATIEQYRSPRVGVGLEVDCDGLGRLMVTDEVRSRLDLLVGAVHFLPERMSKHPNRSQMIREFMEYTERLVTAGVAILAHPFRIFQWAEMSTPVELFPLVADLLAQYGVAAEINFHVHVPDVKFCEECIARGVKLATSTDSHRLHEVAGLQSHMHLIKQMAPGRDLDSLLLHSAVY